MPAPNKYGFAFLDAAYSIGNQLNSSKTIHLDYSKDDAVNPDSFYIFDNCLDDQKFIIEEKLLLSINCIVRENKLKPKPYACLVTEGMAGICLFMYM